MRVSAGEELERQRARETRIIEDTYPFLDDAFALIDKVETGTVRVVEYILSHLVVGEHRDVDCGGDALGVVGRVGLVREGHAVPVEYLCLGRDADGGQELAVDHCVSIIHSDDEMRSPESNRKNGRRIESKLKGVGNGVTSLSSPLTRHDVRAFHRLGHIATAISNCQVQ